MMSEKDIMLFLPLLDKETLIRIATAALNRVNELGEEIPEELKIQWLQEAKSAHEEYLTSGRKGLTLSEFRQKYGLNE